ncbi:signal transduction histidine kinase, LytS [Thermosinus carboxydivorans Nor1]|uniref:histidine kinase n=1 Tax=Thermosinus carboxydivorans Nor1 TaxID=401526 RepID=A1HLU7_9FIRM|nr:LytS/YhcK type 5TM receptor domain-containing protein [Thermosinus carboxydivorans]EAX48801.1 signal transduction histidine kinase, LytS [Thermosinus carboxydivorans Nor1]
MPNIGPLLWDIVRNVALVGIGAYLTTRLPTIRRTLTASEYRLLDRIILAMVFGAFSAFGNWIGIPVMGSFANTRIVGPVAGGLLGGPLVGIGAGIIGAIPRYFMGGFTMWAAVLANIVAGCISGLVHKKCGAQRINLKVALATALLCEIVLKVLVLTLSKPFSAAWELEKVIALPTITANSLAVGLFIYIVRDVFAEQEKAQARSAQQAIRMLQQTSGFMHKGLNNDTAGNVAQIIYRETNAAAVAITDTEKVLAFVGAGADHHRPGQPILTGATKQAIKDRRTIIINNKNEVGCPDKGCQLTAVVAVPLIVSDELVGSIKLYKSGNEVISSYEAELIRGIADFLSLQLAQRKLVEQQMLLAQAEYNMLKAQINPHFLFNTLGTIRAMTRIDPSAARALIKDLSDFLRKVLNREEEIISLREELETVRTYVRIQCERFQDRLRFFEHIPEELLDCRVPVFSLQPLVENAVKHGVSPKKTGGTVVLRAWKDQDDLCIAVEDDGVGFSAAKRETSGGIGLYNVHKRLQILYGNRYGLRIESAEKEGTRVIIRLPEVRAGVVA